MKRKGIKIALLIVLILTFSSTCVMMGSSCLKEPPIEEISAFSISSSTNTTKTDTIMGYDRNVYSHCPEFYYTLKCNYTGIYYVSVACASLKPSDIFFEIKDAPIGGYAFTPIVACDNMKEFTYSSNKGDARIFAIRLTKGFNYYVTLYNEQEKDLKYTTKVRYASQESYTTKQTSTNNYGKGDVKLLDSMVWCNVLSGTDAPTKSNGVTETVMVAYLNRNDTDTFYDILQKIGYASKVKISSVRGEAAWFVFSTALSLLPAGKVPAWIVKAAGVASAVDTFKDIVGLISDHSTIKKQADLLNAAAQYDTKYEGLRGKKASKGVVYQASTKAGVKVVIKRNYKEFKVTCEAWEDKYTSSGRTIYGSAGNVGTFMKLRTMEALFVENTTIKISA